MEGRTIKMPGFGTRMTLALVGAIGLGVAGASPASAQTALQACINTKTHAPRLIATGKGCKKTETLDNIGATGPQGPPGPPGSADAWAFSGNAGKDPAANFLGTTDNQSFEIRVNALRVMRYSPVAKNANNDAAPDLLGGDAGNAIGAGVQGATIAGGGGVIDNSPATQSVAADFGTIGGGVGNLILGGAGASLAGVATTISGGSLNVAGAPTGPALTGVLDGALPGQGASIGGGLKNAAVGVAATISGGIENVALGNAGTVAGGFRNQAKGDFSFAAGSQAFAKNLGSFVWSDTSGQANSLTFSDTLPNQFAVRATGGVLLETAMDPNNGGLFQKGCVLDAGGNFACTGVISGASDRNLKDSFKPVAASDVLKGVAALPMTSWTFKGDKVRHIGPMSQDFYSTFQVGADDKHISTTDAQGVALAAIQGLYQELQAKDAELAQQKQQIAEQGRQIKALMAQRDAEHAEQNAQEKAVNARLDKLERENQLARDASSMHPASAVEQSRRASVNSF